MSWLLNSSIGRKFIMALSGFALILFLLFHMSMNLVSIISMDAYEALCGFLGTNWYAIAGTGGLAVLFIVHIVYASMLTIQNQKARGGDKYASSSGTIVEWSSKNMYVLGAFIGAFLLVHLYDFWFKMQFSELFHLSGAVAPEQTGELMHELFAQPIRIIIYLVGVIALWFHLTHGFWSMFQSSGINGRTWLPRLKNVGYVVAAIICIGFAIVPIFFFAKSILCTSCM
ncbi:MAG: succinate dehydrogenase cytochrome b subunit [Dysgonomonas sp.]|nr:succinate dehydrogenase cytochrome b subunit [Dysgonomonas sp.]